MLYVVETTSAAVSSPAPRQKKKPSANSFASSIRIHMLPGFCWKTPMQIPGPRMSEHWLCPLQRREFLLSYVRSSLLSESTSTSLRPFLARGYTCNRDPAGNPQCMPQNPQCGDPKDIPCNGQNFCCRTFILFLWRRSVLVTPFSLLAPGFKCELDGSGNPRCSTLTTTVPPSFPPSPATPLLDPRATPVPTAL